MEEQKQRDSVCLTCNASLSEPVKLPGVDYKMCVECTDSMFIENVWPCSKKMILESLPADFVGDMINLLKNMTYEYVEIESKYSRR